MQKWVFTIPLLFYTLKKARRMYRGKIYNFNGGVDGGCRSEMGVVDEFSLYSGPPKKKRKAKREA